jgi:hypothetical protein
MKKKMTQKRGGFINRRTIIGATGQNGNLKHYYESELVMLFSFIW